MNMDNSTSGFVLLVGEGNFSFTTALLKKYPEAKLSTSSLLSEEQCFKLHSLAERNVSILKEKGVCVLYEVDATKLHDNPTILQHQYSRIIFNFPHIGGKSNITKNRQLLRNFFSSAAQIMQPDGDILVTLAQGQGGTPADQPIREWHDSWQVVGEATYSDFILTDVVPFHPEEYPEYCSTGFRSGDKSFFTKRALTYIFKRGHPLLQPQGNVWASICVQGQNYQTTAYISRKLNRGFLGLTGHPLNLVHGSLETYVGHNTHFLLTEQIQLNSPFMTCHRPSNIHYTLKATDTSEKTESAESIVDAENGDSLSTEIPPVGDCSADLSVCLRSSLLVQLLEQVQPKDMFPERLYYCYGDCFVRRPTGSCDLPAHHDIAGVLCLEPTSEAPVRFGQFLKDLLAAVFDDKNVKVMLSTPLEITVPGEDLFQKDSITVLELSYQSTNQMLMAACNHVNPTGPACAENSRKLEKVAKLCKEVGYFGKLSDTSNLHKDLWAFAINLNDLAQIKFSIPDARLLWLETSGEQCTWDFRLPGLYPPMWRHDLSFWENPDREFDEAELLDIIYSVAGDALKQVLLVNRWEEPGTGRVSRCYREIYQSSAHALSHALAHDFQNAVRLTVQKEMGVMLR